MAKGQRTGTRKRRTREHIIADLARNHVERFVLRCGYTMERISSDYGIDATVTTYTSRGEVENGLISMQFKATDHLQRLRRAEAIAVRVQRRDLLYWCGEVCPVILVIYDPQADQAYWWQVQDLRRGGRVFELGRIGGTLTLQVPLAQVVNEDAIRDFRRSKLRSLVAW